MSFLYKLILAGCIVVSAFSCANKKPVTEKETQAQSQTQAYSVTFQLPFESSNYENDTGFILKDMFGKICLPTLDTVTKGGGTIIYDSLLSGKYIYSIKTLFGETFNRTISLVKDTTISLSHDDIYTLMDAIYLDSLTSADSIKIVLYDSALNNEIIIRKAKDRYMIRIEMPWEKNRIKQTIKDSATTIRALIELQVSMLGLKAAGMIDPDAVYFYNPETYFYMKTGKEYINCDNILQEYFNKAHRQFIKSILQ
jgi:hypothetical protein